MRVIRFTFSQMWGIKMILAHLSKTKSRSNTTKHVKINKTLKYINGF